MFILPTVLSKQCQQDRFGSFWFSCLLFRIKLKAGGGDAGDAAQLQIVWWVAGPIGVAVTKAADRLEANGEHVM